VAIMAISGLADVAAMNQCFENSIDGTPGYLGFLMYRRQRDWLALTPQELKYVERPCEYGNEIQPLSLRLVEHRSTPITEGF